MAAAGKQPPDSPGQQPLDFPEPSRGNQLWMLDHINLAAYRIAAQGVPGAGQAVSAAHQLLVLARIDSRCRKQGICYERQENMAAHFKVSLRTIKAAIAALKEQGLIAIAREARGDPRRAGKANRYVIVWGQMALRSGWSASPLAHDQSATDDDQSATDDDQSATDDDQSATDDFGSLYRTVKRTVKDKPSPPSPSSRTNANGDQAVTSEHGTWEEAEDLLFELGLATRSKAIRTARANRLSPAAVIALARTYQRDQTRYQGPGALAWAIAAYRPGCAPDDPRFWPARPAEKLPF